MIAGIELKEIPEAIDLLYSKQNILICNPKKPDGDSMGSAIALYLSLKKLNKCVELYCPDKIPKKFSYLSGIKQFQQELDSNKFDLIITLDFGDIRGFALPSNIKSDNSLVMLNIDHHITNTHFGDLNVVDPSSAACCEVVYFIIKGLGVNFDRDISTALLTGLSTDTGSFQHSNTSSRVLNIASILLSYGAKLKKITSEVYNNKSVPALKLWGLALERLQFDKKRKISYSIITQDDFDALQANLSDLEGAITLLSNVPGSKATILFSEYDNKIKGSLRTEDDKVDVSKLAGYLGGGGHKKASGFTLSGQIFSAPKGWKIVLV
ncbi:MAG: bifunctional oligoribonuclease/PAP phosphatase NrnA [bacterium]